MSYGLPLVCKPRFNMDLEQKIRDLQFRIFKKELDLSRIKEIKGGPGSVFSFGDLLKAFDEGWDKGWGKGQTQGFGKGWDEGCDKGWCKGHDKGWDKGFDKGSDKKGKVNMAKGFIAEGWHKGFDDGYDTGTSNLADALNKAAIEICEEFDGNAANRPIQDHLDLLNLLNGAHLDDHGEGELLVPGTKPARVRELLELRTKVAIEVKAKAALLALMARATDNRKGKGKGDNAGKGGNANSKADGQGKGDEPSALNFRVSPVKILRNFNIHLFNIRKGHANGNGKGDDLTTALARSDDDGKRKGEDDGRNSSRSVGKGKGGAELLARCTGFVYRGELGPEISDSRKEMLLEKEAQPCHGFPCHACQAKAELRNLPVPGLPEDCWTQEPPVSFPGPACRARPSLRTLRQLCHARRGWQAIPAHLTHDWSQMHQSRLTRDLMQMQQEQRNLDRSRSPDSLTSSQRRLNITFGDFSSSAASPSGGKSKGRK